MTAAPKTAPAGVKIKICGLYRPCDVGFVNEARPDFAGFVINFPKSHRSVTPGQAAALRERLEDGILPVGVFVNESAELVAELLNAGVISLAQLHGQEDEAYIKKLRSLTDKGLVQAFKVREAADITRAIRSSADYILLDNGTGTGQAFDWDLVRNVARPWFLAGGLTPENISEAARRMRPWAVDISSGVETERLKDREKILAAVHAVRGTALCAADPAGCSGI